jgi:hypothetical protein
MKKFKKLGGAAIDLEQVYRQAMKYGGRAKYQYSGQMNSEDATDTDKAMYEYANIKKGIPTEVLNKAQYKDMDKSTLNKPNIGQYKGYDIKIDNYEVTPYMDEIVDKPTQIINTVKAEDIKKGSNYADRQSAAKAAGTTSSGRSKEILNYMNEAVPGMFAIESREGDETVNILGPEGLKLLRTSDQNFTEDEIKNFKEEDIYNKQGRIANYLLKETEWASARSKGSGEKGYGSLATGDKGSNMMSNPLSRDLQHAINNNSKFNMKSIKAKAERSGYKMTEEEADYIASKMNNAIDHYNIDSKSNNINDPQTFQRFIDKEGLFNDKILSKYYTGVTPKTLSRDATNLVKLKTEEEIVQNKPVVNESIKTNPGNKLKYEQGFSKTNNTQLPPNIRRPPEIPTKNTNYFMPSNNYITTPPSKTSNTTGRVQSGTHINPATRQKTIQSQNEPKTNIMKKYSTEELKYRNGGNFSMDNARVLYRKGINNFDPRTPYQMGGNVPFYSPRMVAQFSNQIDSVPFQKDPLNLNQTTQPQTEYPNNPYMLEYDEVGRPIAPKTRDPFSEEWMAYQKALHQMRNPNEEIEYSKKHLKKITPKEFQHVKRQHGGPMSWIEKNRMMKYGR